MTQDKKPEDVGGWERAHICFAYALLHFTIVILIWGVFLLVTGKDMMTLRVAFDALAYMYPFLMVFLMTRNSRSDHPQLHLFRGVSASYASGFIISMMMTNNQKTPELVWQTLSNYLFP